ncbi:hypothetical protein LguiA_011560 [Lonicera macranthoides]
MALQQTPSLAKKNLSSSRTTKTPLTNPHIPCMSLNPKPLQSTLFSSPTSLNKLCTNGRIKTSIRNDYYEPLEVPHYPKPSEIQWKKEICNSVQLIGIVSVPVEIKHLSSGKVLAWSRLAVKKSPTDTTWINLTFWDELALVAFQHVEKGHQIYVSGRLVSDTVESDDGKQRTFYKIVVQQLNFIERSGSSMAFNNGDSSEGRTPKHYAANSTRSIEELWQAFFANPLDWWDNRKNKRNPNYPDFKHKDTGEALWVEGRYNPPWVKSQLSVLDIKMESFHEQNASTNSTAGDDFMPLI